MSTAVKLVVSLVTLDLWPPSNQWSRVSTYSPMAQTPTAQTPRVRYANCAFDSAPDIHGRGACGEPDDLELVAAIRALSVWHDLDLRARCPT